MKPAAIEARARWLRESPTRKYVRKHLGKRSVREMAEDLGVSTQSIYQHVKAIREEQEEAAS